MRSDWLTDTEVKFSDSRSMCYTLQIYKFGF